mmetsp:Transcript_44269/g.73736  ORF Transcript_44269/g.73736 Transcript_44269/m.73736 type:complete len:134 (-) Transcript_44269:201-602(-)|eukprot:CAMPEP_0198210918 /NCGR_PEP_ID=MMETSP1445-20131203/22518_1 /TAXON_ID=36898 /ORGANISM="Pyramimonas sp., Strain CCMP2087" /LENGTH=133 /DNA_ID=CAMNT_0043885085 /DNA_START=97 /DNA_END=498 /DNA_ORIENTATION=-
MAGRPVPFLRTIARGFATKRTGFGKKRATPAEGAVVAHQEHAVATAEEWKEVKDEASGQFYFWNQRTNETTALGEPRPSAEGRLVPQQQGGAAPSFGSNLAGMAAAGVGMGVAHAAVGSLFGGFGGGGDGGGE